MAHMDPHDIPDQKEIAFEHPFTKTDFSEFSYLNSPCYDDTFNGLEFLVPNSINQKINTPLIYGAMKIDLAL